MLSDKEKSGPLRQDQAPAIQGVLFQSAAAADESEEVTRVASQAALPYPHSQQQPLEMSGAGYAGYYPPMMMMAAPAGGDPYTATSAEYYHSYAAAAAGYPPFAYGAPMMDYYGSGLGAAQDSTDDPAYAAYAYSQHPYANYYHSYVQPNQDHPHNPSQAHPDSVAQQEPEHERESHNAHPRAQQGPPPNQEDPTKPEEQPQPEQQELPQPEPEAPTATTNLAPHPISLFIPPTTEVGQNYAAPDQVLSKDASFQVPKEEGMRYTAAGKRPKLSLASLIGQAILSAPGHKARLSSIYQWIANRYPEFYQLNCGGWQNSIRHNLTINKAFVRVAKMENEAGGKGSFWAIHPDHLSEFQDGIFVGKIRGAEYRAAPKELKPIRKRTFSSCAAAGEPYDVSEGRSTVTAGSKSTRRKSKTTDKNGPSDFAHPSNVGGFAANEYMMMGASGMAAPSGEALYGAYGYSGPAPINYRGTYPAYTVADGITYSSVTGGAASTPLPYAAYYPISQGNMSASQSGYSLSSYGYPSNSEPTSPWPPGAMSLPTNLPHPYPYDEGSSAPIQTQPFTNSDGSRTVQRMVEAAGEGSAEETRGLAGENRTESLLRAVMINSQAVESRQDSAASLPSMMDSHLDLVPESSYSSAILAQEVQEGEEDALAKVQDSLGEQFLDAMVKTKNVKPQHDAAASEQQQPPAPAKQDPLEA